ncbi:MAG: sodium-dependent bicarbonate transport family permease [Saprospiraceae bacterium]
MFKGFLALFLLDMGMVAARRFESFRKSMAISHSSLA